MMRHAHRKRAAKREKSHYGVSQPCDSLNDLKIKRGFQESKLVRGQA